MGADTSSRFFSLGWLQGENFSDFTVNEIPSLGSLHLSVNCSSNNPINECLLNTYFVLGSALCTGDAEVTREM